jgi:SHO1 osmosensor
MNGNMGSSMRGRSGGMGGMSMDNVFGDPFALATLSIALVSLAETTECHLTN